MHAALIIHLQAGAHGNLDPCQFSVFVSLSQHLSLLDDLSVSDAFGAETGR